MDSDKDRIGIADTDLHLIAVPCQIHGVIRHPNIADLINMPIHGDIPQDPVMPGGEIHGYDLRNMERVVPVCLYRDIEAACGHSVTVL